GQRLARQHLDREAHRVRPLLHRELVGHARPEDHVADAHQGLLPQARILTPADRARGRPHQGLPTWLVSSSLVPPASSARTSPKRSSIAVTASSASTTCSPATPP